MRSAVIATITAAAALAMGGCTSTQTGEASPTSGGNPALSSSATSGTQAGANSLIGLDACTLLADSEAQQAVPGAGSHQDLGDIGGEGVSSCKWSKSAGDDFTAHTFGTTVRPMQGIKGIVVSPGGQLSDMTTSEGRLAAVLKNNEGKGSCTISIAVGSGRVDITDQTNGSTDSACSVVSKISGYVESRLPKT
ncbi:DUF3558 family protein [Amycolatopsis cynarae]|uniref:DUF3558 family protein n=1 Tax=Amycolatopsis cynarae TaxID=2995223 RepID=A0ABY7B0J1_9PSEU|nr:DUF3558 family protein [Amycolatopsis sp. HUAS 11-8]WAL65807.1 DUF3558 family protein [Amycolatopsis sp. HUAS 11-8]